MKFSVVTLFPEIIEGYLSSGLIGQAASKGLMQISTINPRKFTSDIHQTVDDRPFGGGDGMVMKAEPLFDAIQEAKTSDDVRVVYMSPQGKLWNDSMAKEWANNPKETILVSGRYGGIDHRVIDLYVDEEISVGNYVLSGGELAALTIIDSTSRFLPGVLGNANSSANDSFNANLLECPQFTRPRMFHGQEVPEFLLSGDHARISELRRAVAFYITKVKRPDLLNQSNLDDWAGVKKILSGLSDKDLTACGIHKEDLV